MRAPCEGKRAPAAARLDDRLARPQPQLPAHEIQLGELRVFERHLGVREIGAGVDQLAIEPELIEVGLPRS